MMDVRVLCVDDQRAFAEALAIAVGAEDGIVAVGTTADVEETMRLLAHTDVDVVVLDLDLPHVDGVEGTRRILEAHPSTRVVILTGVGTIESHARAIAAGADAFLSKAVNVDELVEVLRHPRAERAVLGEDAIIELRDHVDAQVDDEGQRLTSREREVLALLAAGVDAHEIARQLHIRPYTCRGYIRNVLLKLGAHSQLEAVAAAHRRGMLVPADAS